MLDTKMNTSYNFTKSIKDKEKIVMDYYKRLTHREYPKPIIKPKERKRTLKKMPNRNMIEEKSEKKDEHEKDEGKAGNDGKDGKDGKDEKEKKEIANKKLTQKRIVIMDD